jgi:tetratricopeptide (TPR) repeat protein
MNLKTNSLASFLIQQAQRHLRQDNYLEALKCLDEALDIDPACLRARICRAEAFEQLLDFESSIAELHAVIELDKTAPEADFAFGHLASDQLAAPGHLAEDFYSRAIAKDQNFTEAYLYRGVQRFCAKRYDEAIQDLTRALELDPSFLEAIHERSQVYAAAGRILDAVQDLVLYTKVRGYAEPWVNDQIAAYLRSIS